MIKNIIFDLGGVLVSLDRKRCLDAFTNVLGFPDFGNFLSAYAQQVFFAEFEDGAISAAEFRLHVREHSANKEITDKQIDDAVCAFLTEIKKEKIELLLELSEKYNLLLLSNNNPIAWNFSKILFKQTSGIEIDTLFREFFISYEMKCSKPGIKIFENLLAKAKIKAEETLFIDDAIANTQTADRLGFKTLLYDVETSLPCKVMEVLKNNG